MCGNKNNNKNKKRKDKLDVHLRRSWKKKGKGKRKIHDTIFLFSFLSSLTHRIGTGLVSDPWLYLILGSRNDPRANSTTASQTGSMLGCNFLVLMCYIHTFHSRDDRRYHYGNCWYRRGFCSLALPLYSINQFLEYQKGREFNNTFLLFINKLKLVLDLTISPWAEINEAQSLARDSSPANISKPSKWSNVASSLIAVSPNWGFLPYISTSSACWDVLWATNCVEAYWRWFDHLVLDRKYSADTGRVCE